MNGLGLGLVEALKYRMLANSGDSSTASCFFHLITRSDILNGSDHVGSGS